MRCGTEEKEKGVQHFPRLSAGRYKREIAPGTLAQAVKGRKGRKKWVRSLVVLLIIGAVAATVITFRGMKAKAATVQTQSHDTASAEHKDISLELSSLGTLEAKGTYSITSMMEGEVLSAGFEEGDQAEEDQALYEVDKPSMESQPTSLMNSLSRSQSSYKGALEDYNDILGDYSGNTYKTTSTGYTKELHIGTGDKVSGNTKLVDVYSDDVMEIRIPFLSGEAAMIGAGMPTVVTPTDTEEQVAGTVKTVINQETVLTGGRPVRVVTIQVQNPGDLTTSLGATAQIGEFIGSEGGAFEASVDTTMNADLPTSVEVKSPLVNVGDYVTKRTLASKMTDKLADKLIQSYKGALDKVEESVESAQSKLDSTQDSYDNYTVKVPVSDQVIIKNSKVGDNITENNSNITVPATIYDLSSLIFEMFIDELDIKKVRVGQKVEASADASGEQTFSGIVTNVSLESTYSSGVSTYPVAIALDDMGDLLPGMNAGRVTTLEEASDVLAIPVDTLMRRNQIYVKDDIMTEQQGPVPAGFRPMRVETGLASDAYVEITSGLSEGDMVYVVESNKNSSSFMMMMGGGTGSPPSGDGNTGGQNRGGSEGHQNH